MKKPLISTLIITALMMLPFSSSFAMTVADDGDVKEEAMQAPEENHNAVDQKYEEPAADDSMKEQKDDDM